MGYRIGIDIGGTFTDFAVLKGSELILHKNLSTPADRSIGVMTGLAIVAERQGLPLSDFLGQCDAIVHATTIADNTLIEMNGALTGLITTEGFRDEMEYRRGFKESIWDVRLAPPPQITPRRRRLTVPERILFDGSVHKPLDENAVRECCRRLKKQNVESVAISYLFSFVNPSHEKRTAEIVAEEMPGVHISCSHQVLPRAPEYDRTSTTVVNAYIAPRVTSYLETLVSRLKEAGYRNQLMVMQASGGVMTKEYIEGSPIRVLSSGPAGGVMGSAHVGRAKGYPDLLCVDMGGTSYDVSVVLDGAAPADAAWNMHHRYLIGVPMVKVETLGAGGGSICHVNKGALEVGPASAGAEPGPICYGRGGERPTITDALVMLGILSADSEFAGGSFALRTAGIEEAFATHRRADGLRCRGGGVRFVARGECQHDPGGPANDGGEGHRSHPDGHAGLRGQRTGVRGGAGAGAGHRPSSGAEGIAGLLRIGRAGGESQHRRGALLHRAGDRARCGEAAGAVAGARPARREVLQRGQFLAAASVCQVPDENALSGTELVADLRHQDESRRRGSVVRG